MNTITIELCAEDRARLDRIAELLTNVGKCGASKPVTTDKADVLASIGAERPVYDTEEDESQGNTQAQPEKVPEAPPAAQTVTTEESKAQTAPEVKLEELQRLVVTLARGGKKEEVRELVKSYADKVTEIPAEKRGEVYAQLLKIGG